MDAKTKREIRLKHAIDQHPNGMSVEDVAKWLGHDVAYVESCIKKEVAIIMSNPKIAKSLKEILKNKRSKEK
ncbi:MAG: hypothetical protein JW915_24160 [Chitinispirillaceae bacterium]|nr:hypothetical protein [Chitinispirillaceae bacterium]